MYKTFVFPFETGYVAVVYRLGDYGPDADWDAPIRELEGAYPPQVQEMVALFDALAISARFQRRTDGSSLPKAGSPPVA
jgi:hypothetical protein